MIGYLLAISGLIILGGLIGAGGLVIKFFRTRPRVAAVVGKADGHGHVERKHYEDVG